MHFKTYINDKVTVFFNLVVILLGIFNSLLVLLRIDTTQSVAIIRNNTTLGLAGFEKASSSSLYQFMLIAILITVGNTIVSLRVHSIKRGGSLLILGLSIVALIFLIVISTAILGLHR
jgi:hypothetical protein